MDYGFPPPPPISFLAVVLHLALLGLVLVAIAGLFVKSRRPARVRDLYLWALVIGAASLICMAGSIENEHYAPFLIGYMILVWGIGGIAWLMTAIRLYRAGRGPSVAWVLSALFGLGLLLMCSLPAVPSAREAARRMQCGNNLKQLGLAFHRWHDEHGHFPDAVAAEEGESLRSWRVALLPYWEYQWLFDDYDAASGWDSPANLPVARTRAANLICPSYDATDEQKRHYTAYALLLGDETIFPNGKGLAFSGITDGTSNTLLVSEACGQKIVWTRPKDLQIGQDSISVNTGSRQPSHSPSILSSYHPGGAQVVLADGSVRFVSETIDPQTLKALTTANAGDAVAGDF